MNFVAQLEDHLRDLGAEARKKHPGVKEASERAILKLRTLQNQYVSAVRKAAADGEKHPSTSMFRSSDLLHPFLLAANYPNATPRLLDTSFKAMKILMEADAICPGDGMNLVRVWMIQAQVVVSYSIKDGNPQLSSSALTSENSESASQSTGSWLGSFLSTSTPKESAKATMTVAAKAGVSSSHGQAGSGHLNAKDLEKLALDILSCLLQLLELRDLPVSSEQWCQSVALCCLLYLPSRQTIRQAAHSTLPQVLTLLVNDEKTKDLSVATWEDLLACTLGLPQYGGGKRVSQLKGAFSLCRNDENDAAPPPSSSLSLDLMTTLLREAPFVFSKVGQKTLGVVVLALQRQTNDESSTAMEYLRILQFVLVVLQTQAKEWPIECLELVARLIAPIPQATEALRLQADFEDGFIYGIHNKTLLPSTVTIESLRYVSPTILWKAGLAMDTIKALVQDESLQSIWMDSTVLTQLLEAASDFCTIGASNEDHMNLVVLACRKKDQSLSYAAETLCSNDLWKKGKTKEDTYMLGDAVWTGFNTILKIIEHLDPCSLEHAFAPSLAVLQHYLKRFPASGTIVNRALEGYFLLAKVSLGLPLIRRALLTSLCKLSLPQWGTQDPTCLLRDNNIAALICLVNIIHRFHDCIGAEWSIVMQTFQELSVLPIASPLLSDTAYVGALSISTVYSRFASFSSCLSDESLSHLVAGLREVSQFEYTSNMISSPLGGNEILSVPSKAVDGTSKDEKETIGKAIMSMGVRALYGSSSETSNIQTDDVPLAERTKNTFLYDYQSEFSRRVASSKHPIRVNQVPFSFSVLVDLAMVNSFRRGGSVTTIFCSLCGLASDVPSVRHFSMDAVAMLIMAHMAEDNDFPSPFIGPGKLMYADPRQNQYLAVEAIENRTGVKGMIPQKVLLEPLSECICNVKHAEVAEVGVEALNAIVESCGHDLDNEAWATVIHAVASLPSKERASSEWSNSCLAGFRCLKLIVDDFAALSDPSTTARSALLDCCSSFGSSHHDMNTSLTAIGLLWTIADQDVGTASIDRALSKLVVLCSDDRAEVRNCAVNTFFSCVVGRGHTFTYDQWRACFCEMVFVVFDTVTATIESAASIDNNRSATKKSRYQVSVHHSRDSAGKQWVGTQALVLRGLSRVLRNFFSKLLETTERSVADLGTESDTPWFDEAWNKILALAFDAATQVGGRDTLDLRTTGTELIVLCAQLSCKEGIHAAITPARVGTNMEVVNGALRSVRSPAKDDGKGEPISQSHSAVTEMWRRNLFLDAFDVLDSFRENLESDASNHHESGLHCTLEPTQVQVLAKFADDMRKLYDCCKNDEFVEDRSFEGIEDFESLLVSAYPASDENSPLVARFVQIIAAVAVNSSSGPDARFLSQAQRASIDILRVMTSEGSPQALLVLQELCGRTFFLDLSDGGNSQKGLDVLELETSVVLQKAFSSEEISEESRVLVLCRMFVGLLDFLGGDAKYHVSVSYLQISSLISSGFPAVQALQRRTTSGPKAKLLDCLWLKVTLTCSRVLTPTIDESTGKRCIHHAAELAKLIEVVSVACPRWHHENFCTVLAEASSKCLEIAKDDDSQKKDALDLFGACFGSICRINPNNRSLEGIADSILSSTGPAIGYYQTNPGDPLDDVQVQACLVICHAMRDVEGPNLLAIAVFRPLCQLVGTELMEVRKAVGDVLAHVDINKFVAESEARRLAAEEHATDLENKIVELATKVESLRMENETLKRQLAVK